MKTTEDSSNNSNFYACDVEISNKEIQHDIDIARKIFDNPPKAFPDEIKSNFKQGIASIRVIYNINVFIGGNEEQRNNEVFKKMFKKLPKASKKYIFNKEGRLNDKDITKLEEQGVYLTIPEDESNQQVKNFRSMMKNRNSYFPSNTSQEQPKKYDRQPLIAHKKTTGETEETPL